MIGREKLATGDQVVILRKGRPWKTAVVTRRQGDWLYLDNGHCYSALTGRRSAPQPYGSATAAEVVVPWHAHLEDYLVLRRLRQRLSNASFADVEQAKLRRLASIAQEFMGTFDAS